MAKELTFSYDEILLYIDTILNSDDITKVNASIVLLKMAFGEFAVRNFLKDDNIPIRDRNDSRVTKWKKEVLKKGACERCGSTENLEAHHIIKWSEYPQGRIRPENGECLCLDCHINAHRFDHVRYMMESKLRNKNHG